MCVLGQFLKFGLLFSDLLLPPKVNLVAGFNRTHLALTSKHLAVEEAVKFARAKSVQNQRGVHSWLHPIHRRQALFETSAESRRLRELSSKLSKLDELLHQVRDHPYIKVEKILKGSLDSIPSPSP